MKKPKFNQLRGTYAHPLRHRICMGLTVFALVLGVGANIGFTALVPTAEVSIRKFTEKYFRFRRKESLFIEVDDGPEL